MAKPPPFFLVKITTNFFLKKKLILCPIYNTWYLTIVIIAHGFILTGATIEKADILIDYDNEKRKTKVIRGQYTDLKQKEDSVLMCRFDCAENIQRSRYLFCTNYGTNSSTSTVDANSHTLLPHPSKIFGHIS